MKLFFCTRLRRASHDLNQFSELKTPGQVYRRFSRGRKHRIINSPGNAYGDLPPAPIFPKDFATRERIKEALYKNEFLKNFDSAHIDAFISAMFLKSIPPKTRIIQEGDIGYHLYVSEEGTFEIYHGSKHEKSFGPGIAFGELALLYNTKRLRSVEVKDVGKVWVLERSAFKAIMLEEPGITTSDHVENLRKVTIFRTLPNHTLAKVSQLIQVEFYGENSYIIREGQKADKFYIVRVGFVQITKKRLVDEEELKIVGKESYFGEQAFSDGEPTYEVNAIALSPGVECFTLKIQDLATYFGNLDLIKSDKWLSELVNKSQTQSEKWKEIYNNLKLADMTVNETLGVGGFGRVDLVTIMSIPDKTFARKQIKKSKIMKMECEEYIANEEKIMEYCNSPFICKLYKTFEDNRHIYFLTEVCLGGDLCNYVTRNGPLNNTSAKFAIACTVEAIAYLHNHGIVYRDLKPDNIMIDSRGYIKLTDFGSSKIIGLERTRSIVGTPEYIAPEIICNKPYDRAVDYWSLGVVLHELLLARPPFQDSEILSLYSKIVKGIDAIGIYGNLKGNARDLIFALLRLDPEERLGNLRGGIDDIRSHRWFGTFDWNALRNLTLSSPLAPKIKNQLDIRYFDRIYSQKSDDEYEFSSWDEDFP